MLPPLQRKQILFDQQPLAVLLRALELRTPLPEGDRQAILHLPHTLQSFESSSYLSREGDPPVRCGILVSGFAYRQKVTGDGQRQIMALMIPGDAFDFQSLALGVADHSVQMLTRGQVAFVDPREFQALIDARPAVARAVLIHMLVEASIAREWILNLGRRDARTRMAHFLCEFAIRMQAQGLADEHAYPLPITHEQFADALGMTPVHVNRTLRSLETAGLIVRNRRTVSFPCWDSIRDICDFNQRYLHLGVADTIA